MWSRHIINKTPETISGYLKGLNYDGHEDNKWDCEDRAYWGVAQTRCKFPGLPMAVALGKAKTEPIKGRNHAVILFWAKVGEDDHKPHYLDPDGKLNKIVDFDVRAILTFPVHRPNAPGGGRKDLKPFDQHPYIAKGAFLLDRTYDLSKVAEIREFLGTIVDCPQPSGGLAKDKYEDYYLIEDKAFWAFIHARRHFWEKDKGNPIGLGVAFGLDKRKKKDGAVLVIWGENAGSQDYEYWDVNRDQNGRPIGTIKKDDFEARIVVA